jgi:hypothetical protein
MTTKSTTRTVATKKRATTTKPAPKRGFMWKLLERKQAELKRREGAAQHPFAHGGTPAGTPMPAKVQGHTRFAGPRRKAA